MNLQEQFDTVVKHLRTQRKPSGNAQRCYYRSPEGLKCAAGALIPDEVYDPEMDGNIGWHAVVHLYRDALPSYLLEEQSAKLVRELQRIHDQNAKATEDNGRFNMWCLELNLKNLAKDFNLLYTPETTQEV